MLQYEMSEEDEIMSEDEKRKYENIMEMAVYCLKFQGQIQQELNQLCKIIEFPLNEDNIETNIEEIIQITLNCMNEFMQAVNCTQYQFEDENTNIKSKQIYFRNFVDYFERDSNSFITIFSQALYKYQKLKNEEGISKKDFQNLLIFFKIIIQYKYDQMRSHQNFNHNYKGLTENLKNIKNQFFQNDEEISQKIDELIDLQQIIENEDKKQEIINKQNKIKRKKHKFIKLAKFVNDNYKDDEFQLRQVLNELEEIFQIKFESQDGKEKIIKSKQN
ncbi:hypothetical protein TTHERM_00672070 (macronuclear) [Tetrahymena thermophila SB210]|uniref:Uncharacterized protein n=1 Tax=Tetrahymena thermophila (strain SB210) TaxID=312017 RepID=Q23E48_TETTS|nr:hypothetical protein TTHERM_00672070 [Tetrahymena thermophila SB210]EAR94739.2 hypothetical protein TTHERM_00672070 [Tetrahymena thermophila SB210]|eukprot:XP_001014984.2 hypothetical protein TTHERM_00672070 [Tetrahymena thermophila SB210]